MLKYLVVAATALQINFLNQTNLRVSYDTLVIG